MKKNSAIKRRRAGPAEAIKNAKARGMSTEEIREELRRGALMRVLKGMKERGATAEQIDEMIERFLVGEWPRVWEGNARA